MPAGCVKGVWRGLELVATLSSPRPGHKSGATIHVKHECCEGLAKPPAARPKAAWLIKDPPAMETEVLSVFSCSGQMCQRAGWVADATS